MDKAPPPRKKRLSVSYIPSSEPCRDEEICSSHSDIHEDSDHMRYDAVLIGIEGYNLVSTKIPDALDKTSCTKRIYMHVLGNKK